MGVFLDKFTSNLRAVQSQQILRILQRERERGSITTVEEFQARLTELTTALLSAKIAPTLQLFEAKINDVIDSDTLNFMLQRVEDDLDAAFAEINTIDEVLVKHENLINDVVLKALEIGINELEARIRNFEFLAKTGSGFNIAQFNTFRISQDIDGDTKKLSVLDPKSLNAFGPLEQCTVDLTGEKLVLGAKTLLKRNIASVRQIFDHEAIQSELDVRVPGVNLSNMIDETPGTFWAHTVLTSKSKKETGVITKLEVNLGAIQTIDYLELDPILFSPVEIISIQYLDPANQIQTILSTAVVLKQTTKLLFKTVATSKLYIAFRNRSASLVEFQERAGSPVITGIREALSTEELLEFMSDEATELISSPLLLDAVGLPESTTEDQKYWEYFIGFDTIRVGLIDYQSRGYYVGTALETGPVRQIALRVLEKRPYSTTPTGQIQYTDDVDNGSYFFHGSHEYYIYKLDYASDTLVRSEIFPILPLAVDTIKHERLILNDRSVTTQAFNDIGSLQFFTVHDTDDITVYRNGTALPSADDDVMETDGWKMWPDTTETYPEQGSPMKYSIQIQRPGQNDIFTVSYTPAVSTVDLSFFGAAATSYTAPTGARLVDLTGSLSALLGKDNIIRTKDTVRGVKVDRSVVRLIVVMRRNSADSAITPVLEEYLLTLGAGG